MKKHQLNIEKSKEVYEHCKRHIKLKHCYNNVFECVTDYMSKFRNGEWKASYGYVSAMVAVYCRHCYILDENNNVIDPTIFVQSEPNTEREYYTMFVFDDVDEYLNAIESEDYMPALDKYLKEHERNAVKWAAENGVMFIG